MKKGFYTVLLALSSAVSSYGQSSELCAIEQTITRFTAAADNSNVQELDKVLDPTYQIAMNRLFGSKDVKIVSREAYLEKIRSKEWGGKARKLTIENVILNGSTACVKARLSSSKMTFVSLLILTRDSTGTWKIIGDTPIIE